MRSEQEEMNAEFLEQAWCKIPSNQRLEIVECIFRCITQDPPGSFRRMIYDRLGFTPYAYAPLYCAGGMDISNALSTYHSEVTE